MADEPDWNAPIDLGAWVRELHDKSKVSSVAGLAKAMGVDRTNVRAWREGAGMNARSLLLFLSAVGGEIRPGAPRNAPRAVNAELAEIRRRLRSVEDDVDEVAGLTREALELLREAQQQNRGDQRAPDGTP